MTAAALANHEDLLRSTPDYFVRLAHIVKVVQEDAMHPGQAPQHE